MKCRNCGTEIADKAIVCYRCGAATTDPVRRSVEIRPKRSPLLSFVGALVLLVLALFLGQLSRTAVNPGPLRVAAGALVCAIILVLLMRVFRRR